MKTKIKKVKLTEAEKIKRLIAATPNCKENAMQTRRISQLARVDYVDDGLYYMKILAAEGRVKTTEIWDANFPIKVTAYYI